MKKLVVSRWSLVIGIIILASFFRLYNITEIPPGLYPDEAMNGNNIAEALYTGEFKAFYPENNGREGLFMNIQAIAVWLFGHEPWALRVVSALFGILTVLGIYFLAKELFRNYELGIRNYDSEQNHNSSFLIPYSERIALLSAFFLATSFWHINFSRIGFRAIMAPFFLTWGMYFFLVALRRARSMINEQWSVVIAAALSGTVLGLGFYSYIAYRQMILLVPLAVLIAWFGADRASRKKILISLFITSIAAIVVVLPLGIYYAQNPQDFFGRTSQISVFSSPTPLKDLSLNIVKTIGMFFVAGDYNWRHNFAGKPQLFWPVAIAFAIGIVVGIRKRFHSVIPVLRRNPGSGSQLSPGQQSRLDSRLRGNDNGGGIILFAWLLLAALPVVISNEGLPHALRAIIMIPPAMILAGYGTVWLYGVLTNNANLLPISRIRKALLISYFLLLIAIPIDTYKTYFLDWAHRPEVQGAFAADYVKIGRELNALPKELPKYVIVEAGGVDVRGIPMPAQTVMFITDTFLPEKQREKNIFYALPKDKDRIPPGSYTMMLR